MYPVLGSQIQESYGATGVSQQRAMKTLYTRRLSIQGQTERAGTVYPEEDKEGTGRSQQCA